MQPEAIALIMGQQSYPTLPSYLVLESNLLPNHPSNIQLYVALKTRANVEPHIKFQLYDM